jgi:hypothetical protein
MVYVNLDPNRCSRLGASDYTLAAELHIGDYRGRHYIVDKAEHSEGNYEIG